MTQQHVVLISGVSSGIGLATARLLAERSYTVFGTTRNPSPLKGGSDLAVLTLDVRSDERERAGVRVTKERVLLGTLKRRR
jgi:Short-chain alcohol dehydrogenase of unknown specificity